MHTLLAFLDWFGRITTVLVIITAVWGAILWFRGIIPLTIRAGRLRQNKIAIFAKSDSYNELFNSLNTTKLFNKNNFVQVSTIGDIDTSNDRNIFIVNWDDWSENIDQVLDKKTADTGLIVYATPGKIGQADMEKLQTYNFMTVTNFRGRLITDMLSMALAIRYARKK